MTTASLDAGSVCRGSSSRSSCAGFQQVAAPAVFAHVARRPICWGFGPEPGANWRRVHVLRDIYLRIHYVTIHCQSHSR